MAAYMVYASDTSLCGERASCLARYRGASLFLVPELGCEGAKNSCLKRRRFGCVRSLASRDGRQAVSSGGTITNEWRRKAAGQSSTTFIVPVRHVDSRCVFKSTTLELFQPNQSQNIKYIWLLTWAARYHLVSRAL